MVAPAWLCFALGSALRTELGRSPSRLSSLLGLMLGFLAQIAWLLQTQKQVARVPRLIQSELEEAEAKADERGGAGRRDEDEEG